MLDGLTIMTDDIVLKYEYNDAEELARAYMSYVTEGGLFIQTTEEFKLGDIVHVLVNLPDDGDEIEFSGSIVWITPDKSKVMWFNSENTSDASSPSGGSIIRRTTSPRSSYAYRKDLRGKSGFRSAY